MRNKNKTYITLILAILLAAVFFIRKQQDFSYPDDVLDRNTAELVYTRHARCRMDCRHIDETEVKEILQKGTINRRKSEPNGKPDPKYALEGVTHDDQRVRIVFAPSNGKMVVITVIDLEREWQCHCD